MEINIVIANIVFMISMIAIIVSFAKNLIELSISFTDSTLTKTRLKQFNKGVKEEKASNYEQVDTLTKYIRVNIFPKIQGWIPSLRINKMEQLEKDIKFIGWDDTFSAESYIATCMILKVFGVLFAVAGLNFLSGGFEFIGLFAGGAVAFMLDIMFKGEVSTKKNLLFADFPELVRIVSGYLMADIHLVKAIEESVKYVSDEWKPVLHQFIIDCDTKGVSEALNGMKETVDMFEVREFVSLVRLTLEQGGEAKASFEAQADKVAEMQRNQFLIQIGKRKTMATLVQGPTLLCNMVVLALPVMINATSMM